MDGTPLDSENGNFVTVVSIGNEKNELENGNSKSEDFVTILRVGDKSCEDEEITEEVLVYRLPGERLGFGLKFEGGTKASENVKRLFIQSCAPDSPASRVLSSWGNLTEGDEVLIIDSRHVNSMTRMDCVKCLKESNVIIKLLVRHLKKKHMDNKIASVSEKCGGEDLPQVIGAEKKKAPPPPPPVPPRKIPRKLMRNVKKENEEKNQGINPSPPVRQRNADANNNTKTKFGNARSVSPESKGNRKNLEINLVPPDAELYIDLISRESLHSLSESDDTASTISTVIDKNAVSSLPSTPRSIQKHFDLSNFPDDEELFNLDSKHNEKFEFTLISDESNNEKLFRDSKLNPDVIDNAVESDAVIAEFKIENEEEDNDPDSIEDFKEKLLIMQEHDENMNIFSLPRLVDFVPKFGTDDQTNRGINNNSSLMENAREIEKENEVVVYNSDNFEEENDNDLYPKWGIIPQLATIGEVEEEGTNSDSLTDGSDNSTHVPTPLVIIHDADENIDNKENEKEGITPEKTMEPLPSDPRQPPDGHEFPDFEENFQKHSNETRTAKFGESFKSSQQLTHITTQNLPETTSVNPLIKNNSLSNRDLSAIVIENNNNHKFLSERDNSLLHSRSQSLCDISFDKKQSDHWQNLVEQRRKSLSKLKGLVIPDAISEVDGLSPINLPEIKSSSIPIVSLNSLESPEASTEPSQPSSVDSIRFPLISPPWTGNSNYPMYSPAFKRKDLKVLSVDTKQETRQESKDYKLSSSTLFETSSGDDSTIPLKSFDSSPTRSESSFEYTSSKSKQRPKSRKEKRFLEASILTDYHRNKKEINTEDESDNDSAVSSSQSSFMSRPTTSPSPTRSLEYDSTKLAGALEGRQLKPSSVEAINRQNILASAKCRSGKDLKVGSPVINRKTDFEEMTEFKNITTIDETSETKEVEEVEIEEVISKVEKSLDLKTPKPLLRRSAIGVVQESSQPSVSLLKTKYGNLPTPPKRQIFERSASRDSASDNYKKLMKLPPQSPAKTQEKTSRFSNTKSLSVNDLRKNFEQLAKTSAEPPSIVAPKKSSITETATPETSRKEDTQSAHFKVPEAKPRPSLLAFRKRELISKCSSTRTVVLKPETLGGNVGITLAGGADDNKDITIHRIRYGSVAYQNGSLSKGDQILSINDVDLEGMNYAEAMELLKNPCRSFAITIAVKENVTKSQSLLKKRSYPVETTTVKASADSVLSAKKANHEIILKKDGSGLGFSIEGGKDSPNGDMPLTIKKIFHGGSAEKDGRLKVGDEILAINDVNFANLTRIQAWTMMKKIDIDNVKIIFFR